MPRRRGPLHNAGRRPATEDGRSIAKKILPRGGTVKEGPSAADTVHATATSTINVKSATVIPSGVVNNAANRGTCEGGNDGPADCGYLHKKFKKVAAAVMQDATAAVICNDKVNAARQEIETPASIAEETTKECSKPLAVKEDNKSVENDVTPTKSKGGRYVCPYCQHACAKPSVLEKHIRAHTNERPYPCVPCGFAFKTKSNLYKHCKSRTHVLKMEESGATVPPVVDGGSDTSEDNTAEDGDEIDGESCQPASKVPSHELSNNGLPVSVEVTTPEKFKTPYKPKFHLFKTIEEGEATIDGQQSEASGMNRSQLPSHEFLRDRISQIISENQAIVETLDPIWPRRYVRQSSRDKDSTKPKVCEVSPQKRHPGRERSSSLSVGSVTDASNGDALRPQIRTTPNPIGSPSRIQTASPSSSSSSPSSQLVVRPAIVESEDQHRKRSFSEGLNGSENSSSYSVRNLLQHTSQSKMQRTDTISFGTHPVRPDSYPSALPLHPQNPEGSIIKDLLLKSRGLLTESVKEPEPQKITSSFTVNAILNPSTKSKTVDLNPKLGFPYLLPSVSTENARRSPENEDEVQAAKRRKLASIEFPDRHRPDSVVFHGLETEYQRSGEYKYGTSVQVPTIAYGGRVPEDQSWTPPRTTALQLFGGEVEIRDGNQKRILRIDPGGFTPEAVSNTQQYPPTANSNAPLNLESSTSVVVTIAKSGLNSGGGVVQVQNRETPSIPLNMAKNTGISFDNTSVVSTVSSSIHEGRSVIKMGKILQPSTSCTSTISATYAEPSTTHLPIPFVPGIPGPYSIAGWLPSVNCMVTTSTKTTTSLMLPVSSCQTLSKIPQITVSPPAGNEDEAEENTSADDSTGESKKMKFLRPNTLPLKPGTFQFKRTNMAGIDLAGQPNLVGSGPGATLVSPETPRPRKLYRQLYLNGHAYTYLGLKCSTRVYFCCLSKSQPMYVFQELDPKLSMYSQWKIRPCAADSSPCGVGPVEAMGLYDSRHRPASYTVSQPRDGMRMILTHSSYWTNRDRPTAASLKPEVTPVCMEEEASPKLPVSEGDPSTREERTETNSSRHSGDQPKRVRIFAGGFKSNEDYTYVRGRGRGRYVCEECGIRCKKPSMLKKHIRTHTDLRPYTCRQCNFSFKTKGNLTKHMKSKAHHKKCTELGIVPVPTTVEEANIDEDSLARQEKLKKLAGATDVDSEFEGEEEDEDDDDDDDEGEEEEEEVDFDTGTSEVAGQFEDAEEPLVSAQPIREEREQEVARSLLDLGVIAPAGSKPTTYPYASHFAPETKDSLEEEKLSQIVQVTKHEAEPVEAVQSKLQQPMDLTITRSNKEVVPAVWDTSEILSPVTQPSSLLASIYLTAQKVQESSGRRSLSPDSGEPHSGMLQAYLTEKALKEGLIKRQQVKENAGNLDTVLPSPTLEVKNSIPHLAVQQGPDKVAETIDHRPNVIREITLPSSRPLPISGETVIPKGRPEFVVPSSTSSSSSSGFKLTDDGKTACSICNKVFTKPSQLRLHINIHYFERPFRCDACAVSFRTKGHLQKHKRSVTHFNKVNMNLTFGTPSSENPRPFKCSDCMIAFRIHGHLAKHLRSKMHIMKLECLGKLPFGTYAEMERSGINLNEIDTTDCHNSLESLQSLAHRLYKQDPAKLHQWQQEAQAAAEANRRERTVSGSSEEFSDMPDEGDEIDEDGEDSDGLPCPDVMGEPIHLQRRTESDNQTSPSHSEAGTSHSAMHVSPPLPSTTPSFVTTEKRHPLPQPAIFNPSYGDSSSSSEGFQLFGVDKLRLSQATAVSKERVNSITPPPEIPVAVSRTLETGRSHNVTVETARSPPNHGESKTIVTQWSRPTSDMAMNHRLYYHPVPPQVPVWTRPRGFTDFMNPLSSLPPQWHQDQAAMTWIASHRYMLPLSLPNVHPHNYIPSGHLHSANGLLPRLHSPTSAATSMEETVYPCEICGKSFNNKETLRQHALAHSQPRPFVCEFCDAGFTTQQHLESHLVLHRPRTS